MATTTSDPYGLGTIAENKNVNIYTLHEPETGELRYIGITQATLSTRLQRHLDKVNDHSHRCHWLAYLKRKQLRPTIKLLGEVSTQTEACLLERFLIAAARCFGFDLVNSSGGGDGVYSPTIETRRKMSESAKRRFQNPEERKRNRERQIIAQRQLDVIEKKRKAASKPEALAKVQAAMRTQEWKDKHYAGVIASQIQRTIAVKAGFTIEVRERVGKASAARWSNPEYRKRVTEAIRASNPGRPRLQKCL